MNTLKPVHGGNLHAAIATYGGEPADWIDLSAALNPRPYPLPAVPPALKAKLDANEKLLRALGFHGTPGLVYLDAEGRLNRFPGLPDIPTAREQGIDMVATPDPQTGAGVSMYINRLDSYQTQDNADLYASGPFELGGREHELVVGGSASP